MLHDRKVRLTLRLVFFISFFSFLSTSKNIEIEELWRRYSKVTTTRSVKINLMKIRGEQDDDFKPSQDLLKEVLVL